MDLSSILTIAFISSACFINTSLAAKDVPDNKQTNSALYLSATEAHEWWEADPDFVKIVDIRSPEEYVFVGHPKMALNIPFKLMQRKWDTEKKKQQMVVNSAFISQIKAKYSLDETLVLMCRSGVRSAEATDLLNENGYTRVYTIVDGFEGDKFKKSGHADNGKRVINGWKNSNLPWTYSLNKELFYTD
jgi:rhodanese-related sulfurtransferase